MDKAMSDQRSEAERDPSHELAREIAKNINGKYFWDSREGFPEEAIKLIEPLIRKAFEYKNATLKARVEELWECDQCGFEFHRKHINTDGTYSCPNCQESILQAKVDELEKDLGECAELVKSLWTPCPEGICSSCEEMKVKLAIWQQKKEELK